MYPVRSQSGRSSCGPSGCRCGGEGLYLLSETSLENVLDAVHELQPDVLIVDSIQTLYHGDVTSAPGSVSQVKECTMALMQLAKGEGVTVFVIGHVNKEGSIAGPKVLEHMVDCVLYFEGERHMAYRILRAAKNRFGATNEIGVFEMAGRGAVGGAQPLRGPAGRPAGRRPRHLCDLRDGGGAAGAGGGAGPGGALQPGQSHARVSNGFDYNRAMLLLAVLEKRGGLMVSELRRLSERHRRL